MQFVPDGPIIPEEILQYLEDDELVFFCGAGVSMKAGLPNFKGLVEEVYEKLNRPLYKEKDKEKKKEKDQIDPSRIYPIEDQAFKDKQYDRCLGELERKLGNSDMRKQVIKACTFKSDTDLSAHESLLTLSKNKNQQFRLVTTNFDCGFKEYNSIPLSIDKAPAFRIPKKDTWNNPVYLHGSIENDDPQGNNLVITAADFGMAYLTEGWASRFITGLFSRFHVLFIGYSVNDPVVPYIMDALAVYRRNGEVKKKAYVLTGKSSGDESTNEESAKWEAQGIIPISYKVTMGVENKEDHSLLYNTLKSWAKLKSLDGKKEIISKYAPFAPLSGISEQNFIGKQLCWALCDETGILANKFAEIADIGWLPILDAEGLFEIPGFQKDIFFVAANKRKELSKIQLILAEWIARFLDSDVLVKFVIGKGGYLHPSLIDGIELSLTNWSVSHKGNAIPPHFKKFWELCILISTDRLLVHKQYGTGDKLIEDIKSGKNLVLASRRFQSIFHPVVKFNPPWPFDPDKKAGNRLSDYVRINVDLNDTDSILCELREELLSKYSELLQLVAVAAFNLLEEVFQLKFFSEIISEESDFSYMDIPSIEHNIEVNVYNENWQYLPPLIFEAVRYSIGKKDFRWVYGILGRLQLRSFHLFTRISLTIYSLLIKNGYSANSAKELLSENNYSNLWDVNNQHEIYLLLKAFVESKDYVFLIPEILKGPQQNISIEDNSKGEQQRGNDRAIFDFLHKIIEYGGNIGIPAKKQLKLIQERYPEWVPLSGAEEEYPVRYSPISYSIDRGNIDWSLKSIQEIFQVLSGASFYGEVQKSWCTYASKNKERAYEILENTIKSSNYKSEVLQIALIGARAVEENVNERSQEPLTKYWQWVLENPIVMSEVSILCRQLRDDASSLEESMVLKLATELIFPASKMQGGVNSGDALLIALNHPAGQLTNGVLNSLWRTSRSPSSDLSENYRAFFESLLSDVVDNARIAVLGILGDQAASIYRVDPDWAKQHIIPLFDWSRPDVNAIWEGLLHQLRLTPSFAKELKPSLIESVKLKNVNTINEKMRKRIYFLIAMTSFELPDVLSTRETYGLLLRGHDGQDGHDYKKNEFLKFFKTRLKNAKNPDEFWSKQLMPFLIGVWPKDNDFQTEESSCEFVQIFLKLKKPSLKELRDFRSMLIPQGKTENLRSLSRNLSGSRLKKESPEIVIWILDCIFSKEVDAVFLRKIAELASQIFKENDRLINENYSQSLKQKLISVGYS